jgi:hypothetical protein
MEVVLHVEYRFIVLFFRDMTFFTFFRMRSLCYGGGPFVDKKNVFHFEGLWVSLGVYRHYRMKLLQLTLKDSGFLQPRGFFCLHVTIVHT